MWHGFVLERSVDEEKYKKFSDFKN